MTSAGDAGLYALSTIAIVVGGANLARFGDRLGEATRVGRTWIGLTLLALVTSFPELITGVSAAARQLPNIAAGDALGSLCANLALLALVDFAARGRDPYREAGPSQARAAWYGLALLAPVAAALWLSDRTPALGKVSAATPLLLLGYAAVMLDLRKRRRGTPAPPQHLVAGAATGIPRLVLLFAANAALVILAAVFLPELGARIADASGLGRTLVGTLLVAVSTSLPELVVSLSAVRIGAVDLAVANLLGSNLFDLAILGIDDLAYTPGPIYTDLDSAHGATVATAAAMTTVTALALRPREGKRRTYARLRGASWTLIALYVLLPLWLTFLR